jgi:hypothetical protein
MTTNRFTQNSTMTPPKSTKSFETVQKQKVGAIWANTTKNSDNWFKISLNVNGADVTMRAFKNGFKRGSSDPDFIIYQDVAVPESTKQALAEIQSQTATDDTPF